MNLIIKLELLLLAYQNTITLLFTLALIIVGICATFISSSSLRELKKNREYQLWIFLEKAIIDLKNMLCNYKAGSKETISSQKIVFDENIPDIERMIAIFEKIMDNLKVKF